jgi:hypothetical protein
MNAAGWGCAMRGHIGNSERGEEAKQAKAYGTYGNA